MTAPMKMPDGLALARTTPEFTDITTPAGLRRAHRVAPGVWGRLRVLEGSVRFVFEQRPPTSRGEKDRDEKGRDQTGHDETGTDETGYNIGAGDTIDIPPDTPHRVEPGPGCRFVVEFHEPRKG